MLTRLRRLLATIYIHLVGTRFYYSETIPTQNPIRTFEVKTLHGYEIKFSFFKENFSYSQYIFKKLKKRNCLVYIVHALFDDKAPDTIKQFNNMKIFMRDAGVMFSDETSIVMVLLDVYLDHILNEMQNQNSQIPVEGTTT